MQSGSPRGSAIDRLRPLLRARQVREFTVEAVAQDELDAMAEVARWTGSSTNEQPWRFIVITASSTIGAIAEVGLPQTRALRTAPAAIAIVLPDESSHALSRAYDEGRAAERILIAASMLDLAAGITWIRTEVRAKVGALLHLPDDHFVRTVMAIGHPTEAARRPKSPAGQARRPRSEMVFEERWPAG
jgi:nitroreductase